MKPIIFINGPMGVGKSTTGRCLASLLPNSVYLDGDWCWDTHPFTVTAATKAMVLDNIVHLLNNFIHCPDIDAVIFCWVMQAQSIIDSITSRLDLSQCKLSAFSLLCSEDALRVRLEPDVAAGRRQADVVARSLAYLPLYAGQNTTAIDVTSISAVQAAQQLANKLQKLGGI